MTPNWLDLPDNCWFVVFKRLPANDVLQVNEVCKRLNTLQTAYLATKSSLRIEFQRNYKSASVDDFSVFNSVGKFDFVVKYQEAPNNDNYYYNDYDVINGLTSYAPDSFKGELAVFRPKYDLTLTAENVSKIALKFPNIKRLFLLDHRSISCLQFEENILEYWPKLTHLSIMATSWKNDHFDLFESINKLSSLTHLSLNADICILKQLTILGQLQEFFCYYRFARFEYREKTKRDDKLNLTRLNELFAHESKHFGLIIQDVRQNDEIFTLPIANRITRLSFELQSLNELKTICSELTLLTFLDLLIKLKPDIMGLAISDILAPMVQWKNLSHLKLRCTDEIQFFNTNQKCPSLHSVKEAKLTLSIKPHSVKHIKTAFPSAKAILLEILSTDQLEFYNSLCRKQSCKLCKHFKTNYSKLPVLRDCCVTFDLTTPQFSVSMVGPPRASNRPRLLFKCN